MTLAYFDSSALVKLVVEEDGSDLVAALWDGCDAAVSSRLAYPEVRAALAAATRAQRLDPADLATAEQWWEQLWAGLRVVEVTEAVATHAGDLARRHALGGADAVHLASVLVLGTTQTLFAVWDTRLREGAEAAGVPLAPLR